MTLIAMAGLPGTGKTTLTRALKQALMSNIQRTDQEHQQIAPITLNKDDIRAALFPPYLIEYSEEQDNFCYDILLSVAGYLFHKAPQRVIILDGRTFSKSYQVQTLEKTALAMGVDLYWVECVCDTETAKQRLARDHNAIDHPATNRNPDLFDSLKASAEALTVRRMVVDTTRPVRECVAEILQYLSASWLKQKQSY
jgi:predicted kinase